MKNLISQILIVLFLAVTVSAQENQPELLDEFGVLGDCDMSARIFNLGVHLGNNPQAKAVVRIYGGDKDFPGGAFFRGSLVESLRNNSFKFSRERLSVEFCNVNQQPLWTRIFIIGENTRVEPCAENLSAPLATVRFETVYFGQPDFKLVPMEDSSIDLHAVSQGEYSQFAQEALKKFLRDSPSSRVYLIGYLQTNFETDLENKTTSRKTSLLDKKSLAAKMLQSAKANLLKNGFSASQIVTINGGYVDGNGRRLEIWFVPEGGEIPKPKPDYIPKKRKSN